MCPQERLKYHTNGSRSSIPAVINQILHTVYNLSNLEESLFQITGIKSVYDNELQFMICNKIIQYKITDYLKATNIAFSIS